MEKKATIYDLVGKTLKTYVDEKNIDAVSIRLSAAGKLTDKTRNELLFTIVKYLADMEKKGK